MANATQYGSDDRIDDPLAELEALVNARTARMMRADEFAVGSEPAPIEAPAFDEAVFDEHAFDAALTDVLLTDPLTAPEAALAIEPAFEASEPGALDAMLPSLAALRGSWGMEPAAEPLFAETEPAAAPILDDFDAEMNSAVENAMRASESALAVLASQRIEGDVPPATHPVEVPELPQFDEAEAAAEFENELALELADELYTIDEPAAPALYDAAPVAASASVAGEIANDNDGSRAKGWLVAAMIGGVAVLGGVASLSFDRTVAPTEVAVIAADPAPYKSKPVAAEPIQVVRSNPVYDRVTDGASAKVVPAEPTELVTSTEDVSAVRIATSAPKADVRLDAAPNAIDTAPELAGVGPRSVRTLRVDRDGAIRREDDTQVAVAAEPVAPEPVADAPVAAAEAAPVIEQGVEPVGEAVAGIPLPRFRPAGLLSAQTTAPAVDTAPVVAAVAPVSNDVASAPQTTSEWLVQIASVPSADAARNTYADLSGRYRALLGGRGVNYQVAEIDGRGTFHRVRIPTGGKSEANVLCEQLKAAGGSCFVTR